jgi:L-alanine-DL-glutamate epimerase-like enolase superfamily enzyme
MLVESSNYLRAKYFMQLRYWTHELRFRHPFTISKGTKTHQPTLIVELQIGNWRGYGEAPAIAYYHVTLENLVESLEKNKASIERFAFTDPERFWHFLHHLLPGQSFLICALDMAGWDLYAKRKGLPLFKTWGGAGSAGPLTDFTIGMDTPDRMLFKMQERPWPIYKIKVGSPEDLSIIEKLRAYTSAPFRVDANAGWSFETAVQLIPQLLALGVELVEQPLPKDNWEEMIKLKALSSLPLIADESCVAEKDVAACATCFDGINIKLTKCGGITPARRMINHARLLGLKVMLGSMNESTIGSAAIGHLKEWVDYLDMDGPLLLAEDLSSGISYQNGIILLPNQAGMGVAYEGVHKNEQ